MLHVVAILISFFCRYAISLKAITGEAKSFTEEMIAP